MSRCRGVTVSRCHGVTRFWMPRDETNNHFRDLGVVELGFGLDIRTAVFRPDGWIVRAGRVGDRGKLGRSGPIFQKRAKCLKNASGCIFGCEKIFPLQSPDYHGESLDYPGSWFWVCGESDENFQKCTKWLIGTLKRLFWLQKIFPTMDARL